MKVWTAHLRAGSPPVLVRDAFSLGAFLFGPVWLAAHRAWIPAAIALALTVAILRLAPGGTAGVLLLGLMALLGLLGRDMVRWSLERRGYVLLHAVVERNADAALARLLDSRAELAARFAPARIGR
ncbi:MAG: DUF2628 domain-containing protein [Proteobacteria bacterium]|nr:DUF2628 domain-containing protein [Pseudomonadota bacterium]